MPANHSSSSSASYISSLEAEPTVASVAASSEITMEVENASDTLLLPVPRCEAYPLQVASPQGQHTPLNDDSRDSARPLLEEIRGDIHHVKLALDGLKRYVDYVSEQITEASEKLENFDDLVNSRIDRPTQGPINCDVQRDITELKMDVKKLMLLIPSYNEYAQHGKRLITRECTGKVGKVPNFFKNEMLARMSEFKDFKALYDCLSNKQKLCLLCFSIFPEKEIIKKRFMFNWWTGEGFVAPVKHSEQTAEELANEVFRELMANRFILPLPEEQTLDCLVNKCHMHPFVRAAVIALARRANFFDFYEEGEPTDDFSSSYRACLLAGINFKESKGMDNIHMLFNVDQTVLDFGTPELFSMMKNINLLCLGRWQTSSSHLIEVSDTKFLGGLKCMKNLKFLSLQGISLILELPISISELANLTILDLRECHALGKIPRQIGLLKRLTYLDMSKCYFLNHIPKEISNLLELEVLKGFVLGNSIEKEKNTCSLEHLAKLTKLRKLSIHSRWKDFPVISDLRDLNRLRKLHILKIEWGGSDSTEVDNPTNAAESRATPSTSNGCNFLSTVIPSHLFRRSATAGLSLLTVENDASPELPPLLEKLHLRGLPRRCAPDWPRASKLNKIKKLYIEGGLLSDLGQLAFQEKSEWKVEILRLKYLSDLEMNWTDLRKLFPKLIYFEGVECPKLQFTPCDERGVWMKKPNKFF